MDILNRLLDEWGSATALPPGLPSIVLWIFAAFVLIQLIMFWSTYARIIFYPTTTPRLIDPKPPVSVVIAARDEYLNLCENLPAVLEQDYPDFEVIVVNNDSTDDSAILLRNFQQQYPHLKVITLEKNLNFFKGKKFPLSLGIRAAKNDILIFTDADCKPASPQWLNHMQSGFINDTGIVLGIGQYSPRPGLLNLLVRYETFMIALQYLGLALAGMPYMGVGRNLAYRKSLFMREKGFISHYRIPSGDDDLFVNRAAPKTSINIRIHPEAHTFSRPVNSFSRYIIQKRRHLSTAKYYKPKHKSLLALFSLTQVLIYASLIAGIVMQQFILLTAIIFLIKWINQLLLMKKISEKLRIKILYVLSPLLEFTLLMVLLMVWSINLFSKPGKWK